MKFAQWFQSPRRMLVKHLGKSPVIDPTAFVAPNAAVCGAVSIGPGARIMFGAQVIAEGGSIKIGRECIVMENAVLRSVLMVRARLGPDRWERAYAAGRVTSIDSLIKDIDRTVGKG